MIRLAVVLSAPISDLLSVIVTLFVFDPGVLQKDENDEDFFPRTDSIFSA